MCARHVGACICLAYRVSCFYLSLISFWFVHSVLSLSLSFLPRYDMQCIVAYRHFTMVLVTRTLFKCICVHVSEKTQMLKVALWFQIEHIQNSIAQIHKHMHAHVERKLEQKTELKRDETRHMHTYIEINRIGITYLSSYVFEHISALSRQILIKCACEIRTKGDARNTCAISWDSTRACVIYVCVCAFSCLRTVQCTCVLVYACSRAVFFKYQLNIKQIIIIRFVLPCLCITHLASYQFSILIHIFYI